MPPRTRRRLLSTCAVLMTGLALASLRGSANDGPHEIALRAREILNQRCFACHGTNGVVRKNVFVMNRDRLVASQTVIPGNSDSLLLKMVESGAMPMGGPELSREEKDALKNWVVSGAPKWDDDTIPTRAFLTEPAVLGFIQNDLLQTLERNRDFIRYFSLAHLYNAGVPDAELETYRAALSKLINSLSWHREITSPVSIDPARTIFRVDLRDYNWTAETWNRVLAEYPYGLRGPESQIVAQLSGSPLPYVRADWFAAHASVPPLYHSILGLPATALELERQLGIDAARDLDEEKNVARAGLRSSGVSQNNRVLERHVSRHGAYWKSFDFRSNLDDQNIFKDPIRLNAAGGEIIFNLPNGLQAYLLINALGRRIDEAPIAIVADRNNADDPVIRNGRSCMSCHFSGMQGFKDEMRPVVSSLPVASFDREKALAIYPTQKTLDALVEADAERFQAALKRAGGLATTAQAEPINALSRRFLAEMPVEHAAAEAGLEPREFQAAVVRSAKLMNLGYGQLLVAGGGIKRDAWDRNFGDLARELSLGDHVAGGLVLVRRTPSAAIATLPRAGARHSAIRTAIGGDPVTILRTARTICVRSMTVYLEAQDLESELRKIPSFSSMGLMIVKEENAADIVIDINRAEFSFKYAYTATNPETSIVIASGKFTAWNGDFAAPRIAKDFLKQMQAARESSSPPKP